MEGSREKPGPQSLIALACESHHPPCCLAQMLDLARLATSSEGVKLVVCILDAQLSLFPSRKRLLWEITQNGWPGATGMQTTHPSRSGPGLRRRGFCHLVTSLNTLAALPREGWWGRAAGRAERPLPSEPEARLVFH